MGEDDDIVDGFDDDDEANIDVDGVANDDDDDDIRNSNRIIYDHIPYPFEDSRRHTNVDATCEDDDILVMTLSPCPTAEVINNNSLTINSSSKETRPGIPWPVTNKIVAGW